jgi:cytochrome c553
MKNHSLGKVSMILLMLVLLIGCEKTNNSKYTPPADHTISKDGFMHKSGLDQPLTNCISCHGSDLEGGTTGVSCFECHGKEW